MRVLWPNNAHHHGTYEGSSWSYNTLRLNFSLWSLVGTRFSILSRRLSTDLCPNQRLVKLHGIAQPSKPFQPSKASVPHRTAQPSKLCSLLTYARYSYAVGVQLHPVCYHYHLCSKVNMHSWKGMRWMCSYLRFDTRERSGWSFVHHSLWHTNPPGVSRQYFLAIAQWGQGDDFMWLAWA